MGIAATFSNGTLSITADDTANTITVSRDAAGTIFVNGGAVDIAGGPATVANTTEIDVSALGDNDTVRLDETNGALPGATILGGPGTDSLFGGSGNDTITG